MFKFWKKKQQKTNTNYVCSVNISLSKDGSVITELLWPDLDNFTKDQIYALSIEYIGILYDISEGYIKQPILDALKTIEPDSKDYKFAQDVYTGLINLEYIKNNLYNDIVIKPRNVFKK
jgi:hypothetical protein